MGEDDAIESGGSCEARSPPEADYGVAVFGALWGAPTASRQQVPGAKEKGYAEVGAESHAQIR